MKRSDAKYGKIHSFQSLGTVDGPGVRSVIFMQGCPLRCVCCHNPDTWDISGGESVTSDELVEKVLRYRSYYGKLGGVTVSGGEPLIQADFVCELFQKLKQEGINTCLDTSGVLLNDSVKTLLDHTDIVLLDYKYTNAEDYLRYTKCDMAKPHAFLEYLNERQINTWIRHVVIPTLNDFDESFQRLAEIKNEFSCVSKVELLPFRKLCLEKYQSLNINFPLADVPEPSQDHINSISEKFGF